MLLILGVLLGLLVVTVLHAALSGDGVALARRQALVRVLQLTDLALFTEARYTRHPSQADLNTPFQDHPMALEHFPTGSLLSPPPHLTSHADLD